MSTVLSLNYGQASVLDALTTPNTLSHVIALDPDDDDRPRVYDGTTLGGRKLAWLSELSDLALDQLTDVLVDTNALAGDFLISDGEFWRNRAAVLDDLGDVVIDTSLVTNDVLAFDGSVFRPTGTLTGLTLAGTTTLDGFTPGSVLFAGAGGVLSQDNTGIFYDDTYNRLGVGSAPQTLYSGGGTLPQIGVHGGSGASFITLSRASVSNGDPIGAIIWGTTGTASADKRAAQIQSVLEAASGTIVTGSIRFLTNNAGTFGQRVHISGPGNVGIGVDAVSTIRLFTRGVDATGSNYAAYFDDSAGGLIAYIRNDGHNYMRGASVGSGTYPGDNNFTVIGTVVVSGTIKPGGFTVATLPAGVVGAEAYVNDAMAPAWGAAVAGGGAAFASVRYNNAQWSVQSI